MKKTKLGLAVCALVALLAGNLMAARMIDGVGTRRVIGAATERDSGAVARAAAQSRTQAVTMDFTDVDIKVFIKFIADISGKNFIYGDKVQGKVTVVSPRKMSIDEAYNVFLSVLAVNGYATVPVGGSVKIVRSSDAGSDSIEARVRPPRASERMVTQIIPLKYADAEGIRNIVTPLMTKGTSQVLTYPQSNILIVTDTASNVRKVLDILRVVDVPGFAQDFKIVPLTYAAAGDLATKLTNILTGDPNQRNIQRPLQTGGSGKPDVKVMPYERTNSLIILAASQDMTKVMDLVKKLDIPTPNGKEDVHVYYLQYASAEDLVKVLTDMPSASNQTAAAAQPNASGQTNTAAIAATSSAAAVGGTNSAKNFKIMADKETNSLVIYADPDSYSSLVDTIRYLDIPRKQVYVKALIMEVNSSADFKVGVQWNAFEDFAYDSGKRLGGIIARSGSGFVTSMKDLPSGPLFGIVGEGITIGSGSSAVTFPNMASFITAMKNNTDVNIISAPQIITMDNREAEIKVGQNVPYLTKEDTDSTNINRTVRSYDYRDVGVTLKITPQINQDGNVRMKVFQEISSLVTSDSIDNYAPTTLKRSATTTVMVRDRNTMVIGGLIGETLSLNDYKVPGLGDIKGLGWLFKTHTKKSEKTNLYIFITPIVIDSDTKADELYRQKYGEYRSTQDKFEKDVLKQKSKPARDAVNAQP